MLVNYMDVLKIDCIHSRANCNGTGCARNIGDLFV